MFHRLALAALVSLIAAAPAGAASVAYTDGHNAWLSSPDGAHKFQLTTGGDENAAWNYPTQGPDGKTVVAHRDTFEDGSKRPVLYLYGADGKLITANVMPVYSGATVPVYPIGMDMDWESKAVAYGYSYCGWACQSTYKGYWLTFSDQQSAFPTDPQGATDSYFPTFYGRRVVSSDSGGRIFVQPDDPNAPFVNSYQPWLSAQQFRMHRAKVSAHQNMVAIEWTQYDSNYDAIAEGISIGRHQGTVPSDLSDVCDVPTAADPANISFSPDGTQMAWADAGGVKVAGVPNLAAGTGVCTLTQPAKVISATGRMPSFGGADVAAILNPPKQQPQPGTNPGSGPGTTPVPQPGDQPLTVGVTGKPTAAQFGKGKLAVSVEAPAAGRVTVTATIPTGAARKLRLAKASRARLARASAKGLGTVVARGSATAAGPGKVTVRLKPTAAARRAARKLRGVTLTVNVAAGGAGGSVKVKLR